MISQKPAEYPMQMLCGCYFPHSSRRESALCNPAGTVRRRASLWDCMRFSARMRCMKAIGRSTLRVVTAKPSAHVFRERRKCRLANGRQKKRAARSTWALY